MSRPGPILKQKQIVGGALFYIVFGVFLCVCVDLCDREESRWMIRSVMQFACCACLQHACCGFFGFFSSKVSLLYLFNHKSNKHNYMMRPDVGVINKTLPKL